MVEINLRYKLIKWLKNGRMPKLLFPFNEDYLKFTIAEALESAGIDVMFDFAIPISKSNYFGRRRRTNIRPDIFLPDYGYFIEVENFYTDPLKQFGEYIFYLKIDNYPFKGCVVTWKCKKFKETSELHLVDPIDGSVEIPITKTEPVKIEIYADKDYPVGLAGSRHAWIQYELFKWLKNAGKLVSAEIWVGLSGHVFAPDRIVVSPNEGIIDWYPEKFAPYSGWSTYKMSNTHVPPEVPVRIDICSYDGQEIHCYEVKLPEHFDKKAITQIYNYLRCGVFDRIWIVSQKEWLENIYVNFLEIFSGLEKIGMIGYDFQTRSFTIIKNAERLAVNKREFIYVTIK